MSCCAPTDPQTTTAFLEQKLKNFRAFVEPHCSTDEMKAMLSQYDSMVSVMPFLIKAITAEKLGQTELLLDKFCEGFTTIKPEELPAFRAKVKRYLEMFREVITTT